ncbi:MAG TPA: winged helix-turn-helix domain-containing protein, partial [Candidatus Thermoplasmatota archaeon]
AQHELARHVGMSASNAIRHLRKLEQVGLIAREKAGRGVEYRAKTTDEGKMYDPNAAVEVT